MASSLVDVPHNGATVPLQIITKTHSSQAELQGNVAHNIRRAIPRFLQLPGLLMARNAPLAICGGGPSLDDYIDKIKTFPYVMVCGSVHDHLVEHGIIPHFAVSVDARRNQVDHFRKPNAKTSYFLASQCHPDLFDALDGYKIAMWHFRGQLDNEWQHFNGEQTIAWGCMVGVMAVQLALYLGFQEIHFFGMDGSFRDDKHHSYAVPEAKELDAQATDFSINGRTFKSTIAFVSQMEHFFDLFAGPDGKFLKGYVYGDGLWANVIKASPPEMRNWLDVM